MHSALFQRLLSRFPPLRSLLRPSHRWVALFVVTAIACWGEPGARGAASPPAATLVAAPEASEAPPTGPVEAAQEPDPVLEPAPPPTPLPPSQDLPAPVERPGPAPAALAEQVAPKLEALSSWVKRHHAELSFALRDVGSGRELLADQPSRPENPASNQKLITAAVALTELGAGYRFRVAVLGKIEDGVASRLVLRGNGDPSFSYDDLHGFAEQLVALGLKRVSGDILVDQSAFDSHYVPPQFDSQPHEWSAFRAPVSAVALERNSTTLHVYPTEVGKLARVEFTPPGYVSVQGKVMTEKGKKRDHVGLTLMPHGLLLSARVAGGLPLAGGEVRINRRIDNPEIYAGVVLAHVLGELGVQVQGQVHAGGSDETAELVARDSKPLAELLPQLGKASDNFYAETLFKAVGAVKRGKPGTAENAAAVELEWLRSRKLLDDGQRIQNGSGLYDANRVSARTLTRVLETAYLDPVISQPYVDQLSIGGVDGTLHARMTALRSRRSVHAKTGTLNQVTTLSGYVFGPQQQSVVTFSILVNGSSAHSAIRQRMDALVLAVSDALWAPKTLAIAQR